MKYNFVIFLRLVAMVLAALWAVACLVDWGFCGSYAVCGIGARLVGFFSWGILFALGLVVLAAPPVVQKGERALWTAPMRLRRLLPLLGGLLALCVLAADMPLSASHGDLLAWLGFLWFGGACVGVLLLALLGRGIEKLLVVR